MLAPEVFNAALGTVVAAVADPDVEFPSDGTAVPTQVVNPLPSKWKVEDYVARPTLVAALTWDMTMSAFTVLTELDLPLDLVAASNVLAVPFAANRFWRCDSIELQAEVMGGPFYSGRLRLWHFPMFRDTDAHINSKVSLSQTTGAYLDASHPYRERIIIPWNSIYDQLLTAPLSGTESFWRYSLGVFGISVWNVLNISVAGPTTVTVNVYARFHNPTFYVPTNSPTSFSRFLTSGLRVHRRRSSTRPAFAAQYQAFQKAMRAYDSNRAEAHGANTSVTNNTITVSESQLDHSAVPISSEGPLQTMDQAFDTKVGKPGAGRDPPNWNDFKNRFFPAFRSHTPNLCPINGVVAMDRLSMLQSSLSPWTNAIAGSSINETDFIHLQQRYSWTESFNIGIDTAPQTNLTWGYICPLEQLLSAPPGPTNGYNIDASINDSIAALHRFWKGSLKFRLTVTCSNFHNVQIVVAAHPGVFTLPGDWEGVTNGYTYTFIIDGETADRSFEFTIPWFGAQSEWMNVPLGASTATAVASCATGIWSIWTNSQLTVGADVANYITIDVEQAAGSDMAYYQPDTCGGQYTYGPVVITRADPQVKETVVVGPANYPSPRPHSNHVVTEISTSLMDLARRPSYLCTVPLIDNSTSFLSAPGTYFAVGTVYLQTRYYDNALARVFSPSESMVGTISEKTYPMTQYTPLHRLASWYRFVRGSVRFSVELIGANSKGTVYPATTPPTLSDITIGTVELFPVVYDETNVEETGSIGPSPQAFYYHHAKQYGVLKGFDWIIDASPLPPTASSSQPGWSSARSMLSAACPFTQVECPFNGPITRRLCAADKSTDSALPRSITNVDGLWVLGFRYTYTINSSIALNSSVPFLRFLVSAGDDLNFSSFIGIAPTYLNKHTIDGQPVPLYPCDLPTPLTRRKPKIVSKRSPPMETDDSDTDSSIVVIRKGKRAEPQGLWRGPDGGRRDPSWNSRRTSRPIPRSSQLRRPAKSTSRRAYSNHRVAPHPSSWRRRR